MRLYDNTRISAFRQCPRKYYFRHVRDWRPAEPAIGPTFGIAWHKAMDTVWMYHSLPKEELISIAIDSWRAEMKEFPIDSPEFALEYIQNEGTLREMLDNYIVARRNLLAEIQLIHAERPFAVPLDETGKLFYVGRLDKVFKRGEKIYVIDHKTTSQYKKDGGFRTTWIESFGVDSQIDGYLYAAHLLYGEQFKGVWVDGALVHKTVHDKFIIIPIERQFAMLDQWLAEIRVVITTIEAHLTVRERFRQLDTPELGGFFPRNSNSCWHYGLCTYYDICRFIPNPEEIREVPKGFIVEKWEPFNENEIKNLEVVQRKENFNA
jgi:hypothetical protein